MMSKAIRRQYVMNRDNSTLPYENLKTLKFVYYGSVFLVWFGFFPPPEISRYFSKLHDVLGFISVKLAN